MEEWVGQQWHRFITRVADTSHLPKAVELCEVQRAAAMLFGWWFTDVWHWDHKTVFSILAWVVFGALLAGRAAFGWRGRRATRWVYAGALLLLLAYVGSRFVLEVLLHRPI